MAIQYNLCSYKFYYLSSKCLQFDYIHRQHGLRFKMNFARHIKLILTYIIYFVAIDVVCDNWNILPFLILNKGQNCSHLVILISRCNLIMLEAGHVFDSLTPTSFNDDCFCCIIIHEVAKWNDQKHDDGVQVIVIPDSYRMKIG